MAVLAESRSQRTRGDPPMEPQYSSRLDVFRALAPAPLRRRNFDYLRLPDWMQRFRIEHKGGFHPP